MALTNDCLLIERPHLNGVQRIYRFDGGHGLSVVNSPTLHSYPFAWEVAVLQGLNDDGGFTDLDYSTPLTSDVEVFADDDETNEFIMKAKAHFGATGAV